MPFHPGALKPPTSGRKLGTQNRITRRIKETLEAILAEPESEIALRALRDSAESADRSTFWRLAGRCVPNEIAGRGGEVVVYHRIHRGPKPTGPGTEHRDSNSAMGEEP